MGKKKEKRASSIRTLMGYAGSHKKLTLLGCLLSGLSAVVGILPFVFVWYVARGVFAAMPKTGGEGLIRYGWMALAAALVSAAVYFAALMCAHLAAFRTATNMRKMAAKHLLDTPLGYFNANLSGRLRKQIDDNAALTETLLAHEIPDSVGGIVTPIAAVATLFLFDWRMGLVCLVPMVIAMFLLMPIMSGDTMKFFERYQRSGERLASEATEYVRGIPVVKVFQQTVYSFKGFHDAIMENRDLASGYAMLCRIPYTWFTIMMNSIFFFLIPAGMIIVGSSADGWGKLADLVFYIFFAPQLAFMMERIMYVGNAVMEAGEAVNKLENILNVQPLPKAETKGAVVTDNGAVEFDHVTFFYEGSEKPALRNISFRIPEGATYALVGPSGGGKTTAARMIPRFFDVMEGSVKVDGIDVRKLQAEELMKKIAFVFQDNRLFKKSIRDNIKAAKPDATDEEVLKAAEAAQCMDILDKIPGGLDAVIGTKGVYLSGGEIQRIALARAILKDAPIIVLDEASAFADPENEALIQKGFETLMKNKTVLMIAHRLSTVQHVDRIMAIEDGEITEAGTHVELLKKNGLYARMWAVYQKAADWKLNTGKESTVNA
jgi:ATP-binding cassette subfamily B protein IrtA